MIIETVLGYIGVALWYFFYVLFWMFPFYWITWPATVLLLVSAWERYKDTGRGIRGLGSALWYALINFPRMLRDVTRWMASQVLSFLSWRLGYDVSASWPAWLKRLLGRSETTTAPRERVVVKEVRSYKARSDGVVLLQALWIICKRLPNLLVGLVFVAYIVSFF